jgi:parallel beta-helix repeat protein
VILTVEAGVEVKFDGNYRIEIGDNTYSNLKGGLVVEGSSLHPVLFTSNAVTPAPGDWQNLAFRNYAVDSLCQVSYAILGYGGSGSGMVVTSSASPTFDRCTFRYMQSSGVYPSSLTEGVLISNCSFENGQDYPATYYANELWRLGSGNSYSGNAIQAVEVLADDVESSQTWITQSIPFRITGAVDVTGENDPVLTIESGAVLEFDSATRLKIGNGSYSSEPGGIIAADVTFRGVNSTPGYWRGLEFYRYTVEDSCLLTNCTIQDGGLGTDGCIRTNSDATVILDGCTLSNSSAYGLYAINDSDPHVSGCTFQNNACPISIAANDMLYIGSGNSYNGNTDNRIEVGADYINRSAIWTTQSIPLHVIGDIYIEAPSTGENIQLELQYGAKLEFAPGTRLSIGDQPYSTQAGSIVATGVIFRGDTTAPGTWRGLVFNRYGFQSTLSGCTIRDAGWASNRSVYIKLVSPIITGCQILDGQGDGIYLENDTRPQLSGNQVSGHSGYPLSVYVHDVGSLLPDNDFTGNANDMIKVRSGTVIENAVWEDPGVPYALTGNFYITSTDSPHVEMRPGCEILLPDGAELYIGSNSYYNKPGSLTGQGVTFSRVSETDVPQGLYFARYSVDSMCVLTDCIVEYCGGGYNGANITCNRSNPTLDHVTISYSAGDGLCSNQYSKPIVTNCRFENNAEYPVSIYSKDLHSLGTGNVYVGNTPNRIEVITNGVRESQTWLNQGIPLEITGSLSVLSEDSTDVTLTITSGTQLLFADGSALTVSGHTVDDAIGALRATGVTFSALNPTPGAWEGILFDRYSTSENCLLQRCIIEYAGSGNNQGNIRCYKSSPTILECLIRHSSARGISVQYSESHPVIYGCAIVSNDIGVYCSDGAQPVIGGAMGNSDAIIGNTTWGVYNDGTDTVDATYNWWGDASGPDGEGPGIGDSVSTYVDFDPWRTTPLGDDPSLFDLLSPDNADTAWNINVLFDWEEAIDPTPNDTVRYKLEISTDASYTPANTITIDSLLESQYLTSDVEIDDDTRYWWKVTAFDTQEQTTNSNQQDWYFDVYVIEPPSDFELLTPDSASTVMLTSPLLSWEEATDPDPGDAITYTVYIDNTAGFQTADSVVTVQTGAYPPFCQPGTLRYWKVKATDSWGEFTWSQVWRFYVDPNAGPRPVHDLVAAVDTSDIVLSWSEVAGADRYDIYRSDQPDIGFTLYNNTTSLSYIDIGAAGEGVKFYQVVAVDQDLDIVDYWRDLDGNPIPRNRTE